MQCRKLKFHAANWNDYRQKLAAAVASSEPEKEKTPTQAVTGKIGKAEDKAAGKARAIKGCAEAFQGRGGSCKGVVLQGKMSRGCKIVFMPSKRDHCQGKNH